MNGRISDRTYILLRPRYLVSGYATLLYYKVSDPDCRTPPKNMKQIRCIFLNVSNLTDFIDKLGASEVTANLYCNCVHLYWEGCVIYSIDLR